MRAALRLLRRHFHVTLMNVGYMDIAGHPEIDYQVRFWPPRNRLSGPFLATLNLARNRLPGPFLAALNLARNRLPGPFWAAPK